MDLRRCLEKGCVMHPFFHAHDKLFDFGKSDKKPVLQFLHCSRETLFFLLQGV